MHGSGDVRFFGRIAPLYDRLLPRAKRAPLARGLARAERPVRRVVDLGGGTGRGAAELDVPERIVVDAAPGMLVRARDRGLEAVAGDARRLPLRDQSVDAVVIVDALHHLPDRRRALAEAARVLRPGGALVVREFDPRTVRGRALTVAERLAGMGSTFLPPGAVVELVEDAGLDAAVADRGFDYTVVGVERAAPAVDAKRGTKEG